MKRFNVLTYDCETERFTPQLGMMSPTQNITKRQVKDALAELRTMGYAGTEDEPCVLVLDVLEGDCVAL